MNQALLTRLFKTIEGQENTPLIKVARSIIEDEKKKGHIQLANRLDAILTANTDSGSLTENAATLKPIKSNVLRIPLDRRYKLPLATYVEHESLRHDMILAKNVEAKILRIEKEYLARERLMHHGLKPRIKILLYGSSGCGKSMAAERIAWDLGLPFYKVRFDTIISSYLGESAVNLQKLFESAAADPCILLLDEFDIVGRKRDNDSRDVGEVHRIVNILLGLLEEYDGQGILIATTNLEGSLDNALFRRFDDIIELPRPSEIQISLLLKQTLSALTLSSNVNLKLFAKELVGLSSAIIVKIASDAAKRAIINAQTEISMQDLETALRENNDLNK
jgi:SpoVK/Ycf46/Vps4 family AAA+-type ATPase